MNIKLGRRHAHLRHRLHGVLRADGVRELSGYWWGLADASRLGPIDPTRVVQGIVTGIGFSGLASSCATVSASAA